MPTLNVRTGEAIHFGAAHEHLQVTLREIDQRRRVLYAVLHVQGTRAQEEPGRYNLGRGYEIVEPYVDNSFTDEESDLVIINREYEIERNLDAHSNQVVLEFLGRDRNVGDIKVELNGGSDLSADLFLNAAPQIPFATDDLYRDLLLQIESGLFGTQWQVLRSNLQHWMEQYAPEGTQ